MKYLWRAFVLFMATAVMLHFTVFHPPFDKAALRKKFCDENFVIRDTVMHYDLHADSLVLTFAEKVQYSNWRIELWLRDTTGRSEEVSVGYFRKQRVKNNQLVLKGFHLPHDHLPDVVPAIYGFPEFPHHLPVFAVPSGTSGIHFRNKGKKNELSAHYFGKKTHFVRFHMDVLPTLSKDEKNFCLELMKEVLGVSEEECNFSYYTIG